MSQNLELIKQSIEIIEGNGTTKTEDAGRTCYGSNDKTQCTDPEAARMCDHECGQCKNHSSYKFTRVMLKSNHDAMLEHMTMIFQVDGDLFKEFSDTLTIQQLRYINVTNIDRTVISFNMRAWRDIILVSDHSMVITIAKLIKRRYDFMFMNLQEGLEDLIDNYRSKSFPAILKEEDLTGHERIYHQYITVNMSTNRSTCMCVIRHRPNSFAMTSTRWIKFDKLEITLPVWADKELLERFFNSEEKDTVNLILDLFPELKESYNLALVSNDLIRWYTTATEKLDTIPEWVFYSSCVNDQKQYSKLMKAGWSNEEAREVLPNTLNANLVVTTNIREWYVMMNIRYYGVTGKPHAQIKDLFSQIHDKFAVRFPGYFGANYKSCMAEYFADKKNKQHPMSLLNDIS